MQALDFLVRVDEAPLRPQGDLAPNSRLPRPHEADEDEVSSERPYLGDQGIRSTYAR